MCKKDVMPKANGKNPWMGLNGKICKEPAYWCRLHEIWLSEEDVAKKQCLARPTFDMRGTNRCTCIEKRNKNPFIHKKQKKIVFGN